jgi:hypothetical protein
MTMQITQKKRYIMVAVFTVICVIAFSVWAFVQTLQFADRCIARDGTLLTDKAECRGK